jgi:hypothetical protein
MRYEEIEPYLIDFLKGSVDEAIEYRIKAYIQQHPEFERELEALKETMSFVKKTPLQQPAPHLRMDFYAMLNEAQKNSQTKIVIWKSWWEKIKAAFTMPRLSAALGITLTATTLWFVVQNSATQQNKNSDKEKVVFKDQKTNSNNEIIEKTEKKSVLKNEIDVHKKDILANNIATHHLLGKKNISLEMEDKYVAKNIVSHISETPILEYAKSNSRVAEKTYLYHWLNVDEINEIYRGNANLQTYLKYLKNNYNVHEQLAALSELEKYVHLDSVRQEVLAQLPNIQNAHLQVATIDWIVKYNVLEGAKPLNELLENEKLHPVVRECAEIALEIM